MDSSTGTTVRREATEHVDSSRLPRAVYLLARRVDNASLRVLDAGVIACAWLLAYVAGVEGDVPSGAVLASFVALAVVTQLIANRVVGLYGPVWRYASVQEAVRVVIAVTAGTAVAAIELAVLGGVTDTPVPLFTTPPVAALLMMLGCGGIRFQARLFALERQRVRKGEGIRTLIVGAGHAGATLALELGRSHNDLELVGFVDDDAAIHGRSVRGLRVLGTIPDLERVCRDHGVERVVIALPNAGREQTQSIVDLALKTDAQVKVLPRTSDMMGGPLLRSLRDLDLADLLGREHAPVDAREIASYLEGATVLVTGAGGSIGSEIARQVARYQPAKLLLLDRDESLLHETVVGELADAEPVLADIRDQARLREIFDRHRPDVVFHAAAHKHVPILERHPVEAVHTNVLGTWWLALTAAQHGCDRFVHISTDKAASPCSVMGASKRAAELVVFDIGRQYGLPFAAVRFGNVLGSRGSVVPTFLRQILDGGPVTVTDPEMTRYFMTIPEAVSLVLQAGSMGDDGKIFLLDMGKPVQIIDLARQMIRLAGLRPDDDIEIEITGARPGERLHEQLHDDAEVVLPTTHPSIFGLQPSASTDEGGLTLFLKLLESKCTDANDAAAVALLEQLLRHCDVECSLRTEHADTIVSLPAADVVLPDHEVDLVAGEPRVREVGAPARSPKRPSLLGGRPAFAEGLAFARPARPPLERVVELLAPSYEQGMLTNGPLVAELEERIVERLGVGHVVAVSSCTAGLMLTVQALTRGRRGPVVLPSFNFSASGHAVLWNGRKPCLIDCDPRTFQLDLDHAAHALDGAAALMATHVFGAPCDPAAVEQLARERGVPVLFDAAHALGATASGQPVGGFGNAEVFSLTPTKVLVAGEGGLVATNDPSLAETLRIGRDYGNPGDYDTRFAGLNARMSEMHAATALASLEIFDETLERRRAIAGRYLERLVSVPGLCFQWMAPCDRSTFKDLTITIDAGGFGLSRDQVVDVLAAEGIDTRTYFDPPLHRQQAYEGLTSVDLRATDRLASSVVSLPIYPDLSDRQVDLVTDAIWAAHDHADELAAGLVRSRARRIVPTIDADERSG